MSNDLDEYSLKAFLLITKNAFHIIILIGSANIKDFI